ncbi:gliding motility-associated C-terminal domain-containing protein [Flavobacterium resistens]|uniref:Gliding motility-associated C-terminal domain-containing protein n=1 Tax=Flavobacterium resistens TaxID=443612 RepID=A0A521AN25_9FLAO|nr:T9SS type B sorting domain-containing protein [Flavobacterium resistens]MRX69850.1 T9SS type B sorting domain-containing protein [Flavobacterium resistens]SMO36050.1 gliding motility-associated C-terminal domain-containing protein [Flavobacterium resistens]
MLKKILFLFFILFSFSSKSQNFKLVNSTTDFKGGYLGFSSFVDYNKDGLLDVFATGLDLGPAGDFRHAVFYKNNGDKTFTESPISNIPRTIYGWYAWGDYDNNGTLDLIYTGTTSGYKEDYITKIYKNINNGCEFVEIPHSLPKLGNCSVDWVDIDNDGKLDIHYVGINSLGKFDLGIFKNTGNDTFTKVENTGIYAISGDLGNLTANTAKWVDFDGDGLKDVIMGSSTLTERRFEIYKNLGNFKFKKIDLDLPQLSYVRLDVGDINNDGKPDFVFTGTTKLNLQSEDNDAKLYFYVNNGNMNFTNTKVLSNPMVLLCQLHLQDLDNDGFLDFINYSGSIYKITTIYMNNKNGDFIEKPHALPVNYSGGIDFGDYDNDKDLDILYYGRTENPRDDEISYVYENLATQIIYPDKIMLNNSCDCNFDASFSLNNDVDNVKWNFDDNSTAALNESLLPRPTHTFSKKGTYTVSATYTKGAKVETLTKIITIIGKPVVAEPSDISTCDKNAQFDFHALKDAEILNGLPSDQYEITYYLSQIDAQNKTNKLPNLYTIASTQQNIFARIQSTEKSICYTIKDFTINVKAAPIANNINDIVVCDINNDGFSLFDLTNVEGILLSNQMNVKISYFDSSNKSIAVPLSSNYRNIIKQNDFIKAKISNIDNECFIETKINLIVSPLPIANNLSSLIGCDDNNDGISEFFDTSEIEKNVLKGQVDMQVSYYNSQGIQMSNPLPNPFTNTTPYNQNIKVRVTNKMTNCYSETNLELKTSSKPVINQPENLYSCDEGSGIASFNTTGIQSQLIGNQSGLTIIYKDERGNVLPSPLPEIYKNTTANKQTIFVKVQNSLNALCFSETSFDLIVNALPKVSLHEKYALCDLEPYLLLSVDSDFDSYEWKSENGNVVSITNEAKIVNEGNYIIKIKKKQNGITCENSFPFSLSRSKLPKIEKLIYDEFDSSKIEVIASGDGVFEYSLDGITYQQSNIFTNLLGGNYKIHVRDMNGCGEYVEDVTLLDYPKFVTPNDDGYNDFWQINGLEKYPNAKIYIYDRYGKLLKELNSKDIGWNGKFNGENLAADDYWFTINLDNQSKIFKGHFSLKR